MNIPVQWRNRWISHSQDLLNSYRARSGHELMTRGGRVEEEAERLFAAPFAVLSHGGEDDPILNYGNGVVLELWGLTPELLVTMPSRLTAEPGLRDERAKMLNDIVQSGFSSGYKGVRISSRGKRFRIEDGTIWNVTDRDGKPKGQAATFSKWTFLP